ncbi:hypothetical protein V2J09_018909 [Rumex salicifolius]
MGKLAIAVIVILWEIPISILVNRIVPDPYMDEIFHVSQAQQYCHGNFKSWDPMITTPPGLYFVSLAHVASLFPGMFLLHQASSVSDVCSTSILRSTNIALSVLCGILLYEIIILIQPSIGRRKATLYATILALYPLHWFFTHLYYTDVASLAVFLGMHLYSLKKKYWLSAMLGAVAVTIRQTNIIWMLFVACSGIFDVTLSQQSEIARENESSVSLGKNNHTFVDNAAANQGLRKRKSKFITDNSSSILATVARTYEKGFIDELQLLALRSWRLKWELLIQFAPFLFVLAAFIAFVIWNGSIVLGAKEAHVASPHLAQIMYFALVTALASAPLHFTKSQALGLLSILWKNRPLSIVIGCFALSSGSLSIHFFSIAHPYLLADNRHYTFYLWRKVINAHWTMRYLLVPVYIYSWTSIFSILGKTQKRMWVLAYFLACAASLVPAPLIEFRYYTIPFYIFMLHSRITEDYKWAIMGVGFVAVNIFTMSMFLFRPFHWNHEPGTQSLLVVLVAELG